MEESLSFIVEFKNAASSSFKEVKKDLDGVKKSAEGMKKETSNIGSSFGKLKSQMTTVLSGIKGKMTSTFSSVKSTIKSLPSSFKGAFGKLPNMASSALGKMKTSFTAMPRSALNSVKSLTTGFKNGFKKLPGIAKGAFGKIGNTIKGGLGAIKGAAMSLPGIMAAAFAGMGIVAFGKDVLQVGMNFDKAMSEVQAISGATGSTLDALRDKAKELGASTAFSASDAAAGLKELSMAGFTADESLAAIESTLMLAAAGGMELADAAASMTSTMAQFGLEGEDAAKMVADQLAKAATSAKTDVAGLGEGLKYVGASAKASNIPLNDTLATLGMLNDAGIEGSAAGTAMNAMLSDLKKNSENGAIAIGKSKVAIYDSTGAMREMGDIYKDLEGATNGMTDSQRDMALMNVFGEQSMRAVNTVLGQGADKFDDLSASIKESNGYAAEMEEIMTDNLKGDIDNLSSAWEGFKIALFDGALGKVFRPLVQGLSTAVTGFTAFSEKIMGLNSENNTVVAALSEAWSTFSDGLASVMEYIQPVLQEFFDAGKVGFELLGEVLLTLWGVIGPILASLWDILVSVGKSIFEVFQVVGIPLVERFWAAVQLAWTIIGPILSILGAAFEVLGAVIKFLWDFILAPLVSFLSGILAVAIDSTTGVIEGLTGGFQWLGDKIKWVADQFKKFADWTKTFKPPEWLSSIGGKISGGFKALTGGSDGSHATGAYNIPFDGYQAELHKGESVLTAGQSEALRSLGVVQRSSGNQTKLNLDNLPTREVSGTSNSNAFSFGNININISDSNASAADIERAVRNALEKELKKTSAVLGYS